MSRAVHRLAPRAALLAAALAALLAAGPARAAARLSVAPVPGARPALVKQFGDEVCRAFTCVPFARGKTRGGFDADRLRRAGVDGVLVGAVGRLGAGSILTLSLFTDTDFAEATWRIPLDARGAVPAAELADLLRELSTRLDPPPPAIPPERRPVAPASPASPPAAAAPPAALPAPGAPPPAPLPGPARPAAQRSSAVPPPPRPAPRAERSPWLVVEVGVLAGRRELRFEDAVAGPAPLRGHLAPRFAGPAVRVEVLPAARAGGLLAGLGLFGAHATSLRLETEVDGAARATTLWRLSAGALWRSAPPGAGRLALQGSLSWEARGATVRPAVLGLADTALSGLRAGLSLELPLAGPVHLVAGGGYVRWLTARDLVAGPPPSFPGGAAWALEGEVGVGVALGAGFQLRLIGGYSATRYDLEPDPEGIYRASGASDDQLTGLLSVRFGW